MTGRMYESPPYKSEPHGRLTHEQFERFLEIAYQAADDYSDLVHTVTDGTPDQIREAVEALRAIAPAETPAEIRAAVLHLHKLLGRILEAG